MLASYHIFFIGLSIFLLIVGIIFLFFMERKEWSMLAAFIILGINTVVCWIGVLGFFGVELVGYNGADFEVYTYPDMYGLNMFCFGIFVITIIVAWFGWWKHMKKLNELATQPTVQSPVQTNTYWK